MNKIEKYKIVSIGETMVNKYNGSYIETTYTLLLLGEVQKSGAKIYFCPANQKFTANGGETFFETYREAYRSQDW